MDTSNQPFSSIEFCDRIIMQSMRFQVRLGVKKKERATPQPIFLDVILYQDTRAAGKSDSVLDTVDYAAARRLISEKLQPVQYRLIEALAAETVSQLFEHFESVKAIRLKVKKPQALTDSQYAAVEIFRVRPTE